MTANFLSPAFLSSHLLMRHVRKLNNYYLYSCKSILLKIKLLLFNVLDLLLLFEVWDIMNIDISQYFF